MPKAQLVQRVPKNLLRTQGDTRNLKPLNDFVLIDVEPFESYAKHIGLKLIVAPDKYEHGPKDRNPWGKITAMGELCKGVARVGDRVVWGKFAGAWFDVGDKKMVLVREYDLLGVDR